MNAKGAGIEAPKALSRVGSAKGCPLSSRLGGLGERRQLPKQGPGRSPGQKRILGVFLAHRTRLADTIGPKLTLFWTMRRTTSSQLSMGSMQPAGLRYWST